MGDLSEFSLDVRWFLKAYRWRKLDPIPWSPLGKPLAACRVAIGSSAGLVLPDQAPFDDGVKGGDPSFREIPVGADLQTLVETHRSQSFDHSGIREDPNLAFPLTRFHELAADGVLGELNHRHLSFMGSITAPGRMIKETAPQAVSGLKADGVDAALLVPV